jgi:hypothetical protein
MDFTSCVDLKVFPLTYDLKNPLLKGMEQHGMKTQVASTKLLLESGKSDDVSDF